MQLAEVVEALEAEVVLGGEQLGREIGVAGGCDMISDLLFFGKPGMLLLTGLTQAAVVRTAHLIDISGIVLVRGKRPDEEAVALARDYGLPLLISPHSLYDCCGRLYVRGLPGVIPPPKRGAEAPAERRIPASDSS